MAGECRCDECDMRALCEHLNTLTLDRCVEARDCLDFLLEQAGRAATRADAPAYLRHAVDSLEVILQ